MNKITEYFVQSQKSIYDLSKKFKISQEEVIEILKADGFLYAKPRTSSKLIINLKYAADEYLKDENIQIEELCKKYGVSHSTLPKYLKEYLNIKIIPRIKPKFNNTFFDNINTEEKAYWLGFIYADGYISSSPLKQEGKHAYTFELSLKVDDFTHLEKLKVLLQTQRPILLTETRCRLLVNDKHFWETLNNYGCTPNKSLTLKFPDINIFADKNLVRHFMRGYFDGDGCITYVNKEHTRLGMQLLGTKEFLKEYIKYLPDIFKDLTLRHNHNNDQEETYLINTSCNKAYLFFDYLYNNSTAYLNRKYERFAHYKSNLIDARDNIGESCDANTEITN